MTEPTYAVCLAGCTYCGVPWRPLIPTDEAGGFLCELECPSCGGEKTGHVRIVVGFEDGVEAAVARAESLTEEVH